jgi:hypothetical protein
VKLPEDEEDIAVSVALFARCGLPGFVSSMDVVHVRYDRCPHAQLPNYVGKEGHPTLGYQVHVGHNKVIYWMGSGFPGARNDKTVVMSDEFLYMLKHDPKYAECEYEIYVGDGVKETKTPGKDGDILSTIEWMKENNSTSYPKLIDDVIENGIKETLVSGSWNNDKMDEVIENGKLVSGTFVGGKRQKEDVESVIGYGTKNPSV